MKHLYILILVLSSVFYPPTVIGAAGAGGGVPLFDEFKLIRYEDLNLKIKESEDLEFEEEGLIGSLLRYREVWNAQVEESFPTDRDLQQINKGRNLATGRMTIIFKDPSKNHYRKVLPHCFISGNIEDLNKAGIPSVVIEEDSSNPKGIIPMGGGSTLYFTNSETSGPYEPRRYFEDIIARSEGLFEGTGFGAGKFYHSEQSLILYVLRNFEYLRKIEGEGEEKTAVGEEGSASSAAAEATTNAPETIPLESIKCIVIDIVTERDMCMNCFKTLYLKST